MQSDKAVGLISLYRRVLASFVLGAPAPHDVLPCVGAASAAARHVDGRAGARAPPCPALSASARVTRRYGSPALSLTRVCFCSSQLWRKAIKSIQRFNYATSSFEKNSEDTKGSGSVGQVFLHLK